MLLTLVLLQVLRSTAAVFTNGFVFDELPLELVKAAVQTASSAGAAVLFDPGATATLLLASSAGTPEAKLSHAC